MDIQKIVERTTAVLVMLLAFSAQAQTLLSPDDYGPVHSEQVWADSRRPGDCPMPRVDQIPTPICPGCTVIAVQAHMEREDLVLIDLGSERELSEIVAYYNGLDQWTTYERTADEWKTYLVEPERAGISHMEFLSNLMLTPSIMVADTFTINDDPRHIVMVTPHRGGYECVFDPVR